MTSSTLFVLFCFPNKVEIISWLLLSISLHEIYTTTWDYNDFYSALLRYWGFAW